MKLAFSKLAQSPAPVRIAAFLLALLLLWLPIALPIYWLVKDSNMVSILTIVILYSEFILLIRVWGRQVYHQPNLLWRYGLERSRRIGLELLSGLTIGCVSVLALFVTQSAFGWITWRSPSNALLQVAIEGLLVALGIGFAEELFFRGWLLDELQRDYAPQVSLWVNASIFALVHGFKPQFPALALLAVTLIWAKRSRTDSGDVPRLSRHEWRDQTLGLLRGRLGLPMGLHAGLVWGYYILNVGQLLRYSPQAPEWLSGVDHNPLAGAIGVLFMSALAIGMWRYAKSQRVSESH
ncbi:MAG: CPBP family intramembrane metalloprotease [Stenomitos rutilans HA7619-LM2]|nr:CPBP family intramembrane metalloprotease [Stenomitos rutilans HA7619-LM2]